MSYDKQGLKLFPVQHRDLVHIISPLTPQLRTSFRKVAIKYIDPLVIYKIIDPHNSLFMTLDGKMLRGLFEHERIKAAISRTSQGNIHNIPQLKQVINIGLKVKMKQV